MLPIRSKKIQKRIRRAFVAMLFGFLFPQISVGINASLSGWSGHEEDTESIVRAHRHDFNCYTVQDFLNSRGGYEKYVRSLGGVFSEYIDFDGTVCNSTEFLEVAEYVWGLYDIWGVDYSNGCNLHGGESWEERQYKAFAGADGAFYPDVYDLTGRRWSNYVDPAISGNKALIIDEMLGNPDKYYAVTNCAQGVAQVLKKAGLIEETWEDPGYYPYKYAHEYGWSYTVIRDAADLQPGDVLIYENSDGMSFPDRDTVTDVGNYYGGIDHTNIVVDRNEQTGKLTFYDSGKGYTYYGECRYTRDIGEWPYEFASDWIGLRFDNIAAALGGEGGRRYRISDEKDAAKICTDFMRRSLWFVSSFALKLTDYAYGTIAALAGLGIGRFPFVRTLYGIMLGMSGLFILFRILCMFLRSWTGTDVIGNAGSADIPARIFTVFLLLTLTPALFTALSSAAAGFARTFPDILGADLKPSAVLTEAAGADFDGDLNREAAFLPEDAEGDLMETVTAENINMTVRNENGEEEYMYFRNTENIALILAGALITSWCLTVISLQIIQRTIGLIMKILMAPYALTSLIDPGDRAAGVWFGSCMEDVLTNAKQIILVWLSLRVSVSLPETFPSLAKGIFFVSAMAGIPAQEASSIRSAVRAPVMSVMRRFIRKR